MEGEFLIRRAQAGDSGDVGQLKCPEKSLQQLLFGRCSIAALIETSYLTLAAENSSGKVVAFLSLNDIPPGDLSENPDCTAYLVENFGFENEQNKSIQRFQVRLNPD